MENEKQSEFVLKCRHCRATHRTLGHRGNPPKKYHCGSEMKQENSK